MTAYDYVADGAEIYRRSFAIIRQESDLRAIPADAEPVAVRMIHACGMTDLPADIRCSTDFACSTMTQPVTRPSAGSATWKGKSRLVRVTGQTMQRPVWRLNRSLLMTNAGRRPACS